MIWILAWRNLWRNRRRTILTLTAMSLSAGMLVFLMAITEAWMEDILLSTTGQYTGQAVVATAEYRRDGDFFALLEEPDRLLGLLAKDPAVLAAAPRVRAFGLLSGGRETVAGEILGVDWVRERRVTTLHRHLVEGRRPEDNAASEAVVGEGLARKLGLETGGELVMVTQGADGSIANELLTVAGVFRTGDPGRDNYLVLTGIAFLGEALALEHRVHEIVVNLADPEAAPAVAARLEPSLKVAQADARVVSWQEMLPLLAQMMEVFDSSMIVTTAIIYLAAGMVVVNTLLMAFHERIREFGVLQAIGMTPGRIRALIVTESLMLGIVAAVLGAGLGAAAGLALGEGLDLSRFMGPISFSGGSFQPVLRAAFRTRDFVIPMVGMLLMTMAAVILPALQGGRRNPAEDLQRPVA